jgi:hypothetical protein
MIASNGRQQIVAFVGLFIVVTVVSAFEDSSSATLFPSWVEQVLREYAYSRGSAAVFVPMAVLHSMGATCEQQSREVEANTDWGSRVHFDLRSMA